MCIPSFVFSLICKYKEDGALVTDKYLQPVKHFLGPKNQEIGIFFSKKSGGYQEFFSNKSNDFIQNNK